MAVRRLGYALGAEVTGFDLRRPLDAAGIERIRELWLEHALLCFPDQDLNEEELYALSACFGELDDYRGAPHLRLAHELPVGMISSKPIEINGKAHKGIVADQWHSDLSVTDRPSTATFLNAKNLPDVGGNTLFANMYLAYDALSPAFKAMLEGLHAVHDMTRTPGYATLSAEAAAQRRSKNPPVAHPMVIVHPETGRKALFVGGRLSHVEGMTDEESRPLIDFLNEHATRYEFVYRHNWKLNDLLMWDNRCTLHCALHDYDRSQMRRMLRCGILGEKSGHLVAV